MLHLNVKHDYTESISLLYFLSNQSDMFLSPHLYLPRWKNLSRSLLEHTSLYFQCRGKILMVSIREKLFEEDVLIFGLCWDTSPVTQAQSGPSVVSLHVCGPSLQSSETLDSTDPRLPSGLLYIPMSFQMSFLFSRVLLEYGPKAEHPISVPFFPRAFKVGAS